MLRVVTRARFLHRAAEGPPPDRGSIRPPRTFWLSRPAARITRYSLDGRVAQHDDRGLGSMTSSALPDDRVEHLVEVERRRERMADASIACK